MIILRVHYIFHSGFLVETAASYYLFDYYQGKLPCLSGAKPIVVFSSHCHQDHYNPQVFSILQDMGMENILAVLAKDISPRKYPRDIEVIRARGCQNYLLPGGEKLETLISTDSGVAYLLTTDQGTIYHAGDLNDWTWKEENSRQNRQMRGNYRHQIDSIKGRHIDIAFLPLDPRQEENYADGILYFLNKTHTVLAYPMHYWGQPQIIDKFLQEYPAYKNIVQYTENFKEE